MIDLYIQKRVVCYDVFKLRREDGKLVWVYEGRDYPQREDVYLLPDDYRHEEFAADCSALKVGYLDSDLRS